MKFRNSSSVLIAAALLVAGCSSDDDKSSATTSAPPTTAATTTTSPPTTEAATTTEAPTTTEAAATTEATEESTAETSSDTVDSSIDVGDVDDRIEKARDALADGNFSLMLEVLDLSGVAEEIKDREVTILAPTNDAFGELSGDQYADLITNPTKVDDLIRRHILDGVFTFDELASLKKVTTIDDQTYPVTNEGGVVTVNGAIVTEPEDKDLAGESGQEIVVFEIDTVLLEAE